MKAEARVQGGCVLLRVDGVIDGGFDLSAQAATCAGQPVVLQLRGVTLVTSQGVRRWLTQLPALAASYLGFAECPPPLLAQFNSVSGFGDGGELLSFYAPFACPSCGATQELEVDVRAEHTPLSRHQLPALACSQCGEPSELDDLPAAYLHYVSRARRPSPPPEVLAWLGEAPAPPPPDRPLLLEKQVEPGVTALWLSGAVAGRLRVARQLEGIDDALLLVGHGVTQVEPDGARQLASALEKTGRPVWLARAPIPLAAALAGHLGEQLKLVSLSVPYSCPRCRTSAVQTYALAAGDPTLAALETECSVCEEPTPSGDAPAEELAQQVPLQRPPPELTRFLLLHPRPPSDLAGTGGLILGKYKPIQLLGSGGMGEVVLAVQHGPGGFEKQVVVKRILPHLARSPRHVQMFLDEAKLSALLRHPNIVQTLDVAEADGSVFIILEFVRGLDLGRLLSVSRQLGVPLPLPVALHLALELAKGLAAAHRATDARGNSAPIIHRDVSPPNVLVSVEGEVKLSDFGIARPAQEVAAQASAAIGKAPYMAPELLQPGAAHYSAASDVFAAGLVLYECLTLASPFRQHDTASTLRAVSAASVAPPSIQRSELPPQVDELVMRCLEKDPARRFASGVELAAALCAEVERQGATLTATQLSQWLSGCIAQAGASGAFEVQLGTVVALQPTLRRDAPTRPFLGEGWRSDEER